MIEVFHTCSEIFYFLLSILILEIKGLNLLRLKELCDLLDQMDSISLILVSVDLILDS